MLIGIHRLLSPELLGFLARMGHGDEIVVVDANFPAEFCAKRLTRLPGHGSSAVLQAILSVFPIDSFVKFPVAVMAAVGNPETEPEAVKELKTVLNQSQGHAVSCEQVERFAFYERCKQAYAIVSSGDARPYACILLTKGVIFGES
jgi:L-fucose mutarotase